MSGTCDGKFRECWTEESLELACKQLADDIRNGWEDSIEDWAQTYSYYRERCWKGRIGELVCDYLIDHDVRAVRRDPAWGYHDWGPVAFVADDGSVVVSGWYEDDTDGVYVSDDYDCGRLMEDNYDCDRGWMETNHERN